MVPSDVLDRIDGLARAALRNARQTVLGISVPDAAGGSMQAARDYSEATVALGGGELVWDAMPDLDELPADIVRDLAAVIRESVTNVARHATAKTINVRLAREGATVVLTVEDDGVGPAPRLNGAAREPGYGLRANRELAEGLGGSFTLQPRPGGGTVVRLELMVGV